MDTVGGFWPFSSPFLLVLPLPFLGRPRKYDTNFEICTDSCSVLPWARIHVFSATVLFFTVYKSHAESFIHPEK